MAMGKFFGRIHEHGMHGNFDPDLPPFGVFFEYNQQNLSWQAVSKLLTVKVNTLFKVAVPKGWDASNGEKQMTQTPRFYSLAKTPGGLAQPVKPERKPIQNPEQRQTRWSAATYRPEVGDMILEINGQPIRNFDDYYRAVKSSPQTMTFVLGEARSGKKFLLRTQLNPPGADSRFGRGRRKRPGRRRAREVHHARLPRHTLPVGTIGLCASRLLEEKR